MDMEEERAEGLTVQHVVFWMTRPVPRCQAGEVIFYDGVWHAGRTMTFVLVAALLSLESLGSSWMPPNPTLLSTSPESG